MTWKLKRRDIAPPGGFKAKAPTGRKIKGDTFNETVEALKKHMEANGFTGDYETMVDLQTASLMYETGQLEWIEVI